MFYAKYWWHIYLLNLIFSLFLVSILLNCVRSFLVIEIQHIDGFTISNLNGQLASQYGVELIFVSVACFYFRCFFNGMRWKKVRFYMVCQLKNEKKSFYIIIISNPLNVSHSSNKRFFIGTLIFIVTLEIIQSIFFSLWYSFSFFRILTRIWLFHFMHMHL